jgi:D-aspartate ligase
LKALVVNCMRNGLGVIRSLGKMGVEVIAADHSRVAPGLYSRYVKHRHLIPKPAEDGPGFVEQLVRIGTDHGGRDQRIFLLPMNDEYILTMARNWETLEPYFTPVFETNRAILEQCLIKDQTFELARQSNVPVPATWVSPDPSVPAKEGEFPIIVKPDSKRSPENIRKNVFKIRFCNNRSDLEAAIQKLQKAGVTSIVQEYIPGPDSALYTAGIFAWKGELVAGFTGRKLRQFPPKTGEAGLAELVSEPTIIDFARNLVGKSGFTGIAQIEFKKHNGTFYLMEINPRSWSWNSLADYSGVNLPWIACRTLEDKTPFYTEQKRFNGRWHYLFMDFWFNAVKHRSVSLFTILKDSLTAQCHAFWKFTDPLPAGFAFLHTLGLTRNFLLRFLRGTQKN